MAAKQRRPISPLAVIAIIFGSFLLVCLVGGIMVWLKVRPIVSSISRMPPFGPMNPREMIREQTSVAAGSDARSVSLTLSNKGGFEDADFTIRRFAIGKLKPLEPMPMDAGKIGVGDTKTVVLHFQQPVNADDAVYSVAWRGDFGSGSESAGLPPPEAPQARGKAKG